MSAYCGGRLWCPVQKAGCPEATTTPGWPGCPLADRCVVLLTWEVERGRECEACELDCREAMRAVRRGILAGGLLAAFPSEERASLTIRTEG